MEVTWLSNSTHEKISDFKKIGYEFIMHYEFPNVIWGKIVKYIK